MTVKNMNRVLIDAIKERCRSKEELNKVLEKEGNLSKEAIRKRVERFVSSMYELGLVDKRGGKYCWYIYTNVFKDHADYSVMLQHSTRLIPILKEIAGITWPERVALIPERYRVDLDREILLQYVKDHLRTYPEIWSIFEPYQQQNREAERENENFIKKMVGKLRESFEKEPHDDIAKRAHLKYNIVEDKLCKRVCYDLVHEEPFYFQIDNGELRFDGIRVAIGTQNLLAKIKKFIQDESKEESNIDATKKIRDTERKAFEIKPSLEYEIRKLTLKIESGEPLAGRCDGCPTVYFQDMLVS